MVIKILPHLAKVHVIRPSDAMVGKLANGTATDWVTRGHLRTWFIRMDVYDGLMYSRSNVNRKVSIAAGQSDI